MAKVLLFEPAAGRCRIDAGRHGGERRKLLPFYLFIMRKASAFVKRRAEDLCRPRAEDLCRPGSRLNGRGAKRPIW